MTQFTNFAPEISKRGQNTFGQRCLTIVFADLARHVCNRIFRDFVNWVYSSQHKDILGHIAIAKFAVSLRLTELKKDKSQNDRQERDRC